MEKASSTLSLLLVFAFTVFTTAMKMQSLHATLPRPLYNLRPFYDGNDTIYTFGGVHAKMFIDCLCVQDILKFSISTGEIHVMKARLPDPVYMGGLVSDNEGNIYHLGGFLSAIFPGQDIFKYNPVLDELTFAGEIEASVYPFDYVPKPETDEVICMVGSEALPESNIAIFQNLKTGERRKRNITGYETTWTENGRRFGDVFYANIDGKLFTFNVNTEESGAIDVEQKNWGGLPLAGFNSMGDLWGFSIFPYSKTRGIFRYNVRNARYQEWEIEDIPDLSFQGSQKFMGVYVEKKNRIYAFGGLLGNDTITDRIWYFDLNELN